MKAFQLKFQVQVSFPMFLMESTGITHYTLETAYKVAICQRGILLYMLIYLITNLDRGVLGLEFIYFISDFTLLPITL